MSIEKLDFKKVINQDVPYTLVYTRVIQKISDPMAGFIWIYLLSLPPTWIVDKNHLMKHFKIGEKKLRSAFSYLNRARLIEYIQYRQDKKISYWAINVLCGDKFIEVVQDDEFKATEATEADNEKATQAISASVGKKSYPQATQPKATRVGSYPCRKDGHIKETLLIKEKEIKKREAAPVTKLLDNAMATAPLVQKQKPSLFSFIPSQASLEAAAVKNIQVSSLREKFVKHYADEGEFARNWPEVFHKWVLSEKMVKNSNEPEKTFADVSKQSTSFGYQCESAEESQRKWEERMKEYGVAQFGT